eukprot:TRINITY_DN30016_c0_g1_i1.p2 TRINITY_DN30016_c0_g1~~TRINITY_DN30016_c0_g1_i1.p2  ORF type:complete len:148 (-),score=10.04 TRINITY_DN30016_c0_g1_i1:186-629(-)
MLHGLKLPFQYVVALALVTVAGKLGDALGPVLAVDWPLTLLFLNANDLHLGLTAADTDLVPWLLVGTFRRIVEDPVFFLIGWHYRDAAVEWLKNRYQVSDEAVEKVSRRFASTEWIGLRQPRARRSGSRSPLRGGTRKAAAADRGDT